MIKDLDYERLSETIEHIDLSNLDTEDLNFRLLKGKFDLSKLIKPIDYSKVSKINKILLDLNKEQDFFISIKEFLLNCSYCRSDRIQSLISDVKKKIEEISFYVNEQENELMIFKCEAQPLEEQAKEIKQMEAKEVGLE